MGFRFRKSFNFGPLRINLSKSGVGYSFGIKGYRVTKTANGRVRQTASIPGTGISYVTESKGGRDTRTAQQPIVLTENQKRNIRINSIIVRILLLLLVIIVASVVWAIHYKTTAQTDYTPEELLSLDGHPKLYDTDKTAEEFYSQFDDFRVRVADYSWIAQRQRGLKSFADDTIILYLAKSDGYIRGALFNLKESDFGHSIGVSSVFDVVGLYLPSDLMAVYKTDAACVYSSGQETQYIYCAHLNGEDASSQYGYYLSIIATNFPQDGLWRVEVTQEAYGGRSVGWIEKNTAPWDFDLSQYIE